MTEEATQCLCGTQMEDNGKGAFLCDNCDFPQQREMGDSPKLRRKTQQDIRFDMAWLRVINKEYTDNTTTDGGTTDD